MTVGEGVYADEQPWLPSLEVAAPLSIKSEGDGVQYITKVVS